jgi:hypothetical protein
MKTCARCANQRDISCYSPDKKTADKLASWCKICFSEYRKQRYNQNIQENRQKNNSRRADRIKWLQDLKKDKPCLDCHKIYEPFCMDFDHVPEKGQKVCSVSRMLLSNVSKEKILEEIKKCDLVCVLCHNIRTHNRLNNRNRLIKNVKNNVEFIQKFKSKPCVICHNQYDYYNMQLDHIDPINKLYNICELRNRSLDILQIELAKCQVLCALCHRQKSIKEQKEKKYIVDRFVPEKKCKYFYDSSLGLKECYRCKHIKYINAFSKNKKSSCGLSTYCKLCFSEYKKYRRAIKINISNTNT